VLKFDEMNAPEVSNWLPELIFYELMNSKPSEECLHPTKGAGYKVLRKSATETHSQVTLLGKSLRPGWQSSSQEPATPE
jgi:hypothetical protein